MRRHARRLLMTAGLTCAALVAARPSSAEGISQLASGPMTQKATSGPGFLVAGMAQVAQPATPPPAAPADDSNHGGVGFGVKGGFLWPSFAEAQGASFKDNTGWLLGIFFGGNRPGVVGVMGEIQLGKKSTENASGSIKVEQNFLEIPILARVNAGSSSLNGVIGYFLVGPVFDINLKTKQNDLDVKDNYESLDLGLLIGGGVEITRFLIEARYNQGFKNVLKSTGGSSSDIKTHSFAVELGVRFN